MNKEALINHQFDGVVVAGQAVIVALSLTRDWEKKSQGLSLWSTEISPIFLEESGEIVEQVHAARVRRRGRSRQIAFG